jgi:opacity protein-like surface antigen
MERKLIILSTLIFALFSLVGIGQSQDFIKRFGLKLTGGYGTMATGDYNTYIQSRGEELSQYSEISGATYEGEFKKINLGIEHEGEFIMKLFGGFGIGIGTGYIKRSNEAEFVRSRPPDPILPTFTSNSMKLKLKAVSINLSAYYFTPDTLPLKLFLYGGVGYYFGKITYIFRRDTQPAGDVSPTWRQDEGEIKDQALGFQGGAGLEFKIIPKVNFFIEGRARHCELKSWEGDQTETEFRGPSDSTSGSMWYYERYSVGTTKYHPKIALSEDKPISSWVDPVRNVRKFEFDLSGFSLRGGIIIRF